MDSAEFRLFDRGFQALEKQLKLIHEQLKDIAGELERANDREARLRGGDKPNAEQF